MNKAALRNDWTDYARQHGLIDGPASAPIPRGNKYGAKRTQVDGHIFDSKKEAQRYQQLKLMQQATQIADLELQPAFPLHVMRLYRQAPLEIRVATVGTFTADFRYTDLRSGEITVEDVKSEFTKNTAYRLRKKIAEAVHGITIEEV
jgi:hypothetical protein